MSDQCLRGLGPRNRETLHRPRSGPCLNACGPERSSSLLKGPGNTTERQCCLPRTSHRRTRPLRRLLPPRQKAWISLFYGPPKRRLPLASIWRPRKEIKRELREHWRQVHDRPPQQTRWFRYLTKGSQSHPSGPATLNAPAGSVGNEKPGRQSATLPATRFAT